LGYLLHAVRYENDGGVTLKFADAGVAFGPKGGVADC
jgi:hypothetical protein